MTTIQEVLGSLKACAEWHEQQGRTHSATTDRNAYTALLRLSSERDEMVEDAERWRAFVSSQRFKMMGAAGFTWVGMNPKPTAEHLHLGLEIWNKHPAGDDEQGRDGRFMLNAYVDELVRRRSLSKPQEGGE